MAGIIASLNIPLTALTAATVKTVAQLTAPTNQRLRIKEIGIFFDSTSTTPGSAQVLVVRQSTAGTMTSETPVAAESELTETLQATGQVNATAEPTITSTYQTFAVPVTSGLTYAFAPKEELFVGGGGRVGVQVKSPAGTTINAYGYILYEE